MVSPKTETDGHFDYCIFSIKSIIESVNTVKTFCICFCIQVTNMRKLRSCRRSSVTHFKQMLPFYIPSEYNRKPDIF